MQLDLNIKKSDVIYGDVLYKIWTQKSDGSWDWDVIDDDKASEIVNGADNITPPDSPTGHSEYQRGNERFNLDQL